MEPGAGRVERAAFRSEPPPAPQPRENKAEPSFTEAEQEFFAEGDIYNKAVETWNALSPEERKQVPLNLRQILERMADKRQ